MDHFRPGVAADASSIVEISVSCRNLANMDYFSKSDPMCVLFVKETQRDEWYEYGRTEIIDNNLNPDFVKTFHVNYFFEERQFLKFEIYDIDSSSTSLCDHDFIGRIEITLGELVACGRVERQLKDGPQNPGSIIVVAAAETAGSKEEVVLQFEAKDVENKYWWGYPDPYLAFYRVNEDNTNTIVHRTEVGKYTSNPSWKSFSIPIQKLCCGDFKRTILIKCVDWYRGNTEDFIGEFSTNLETLLKLCEEKQANFVLQNTQTANKNGRKRAYANSGTVTLTTCRIQPIFTFLDYVQSGTQLNCTIAIDFTSSNGDPRNFTSLHCISSNTPNQYEQALMAVGEIIQDYDSDQLFPVLGFGARLPPDGRVSHEFFVNGDPTNPFCAGVAGVLEAYRQCVRTVQLYGPTNFASVINHVAKFAQAKRDGSEYFILLIITDGVITDMPQTTDAIVAASYLPLSIIIVGVGDADFDAMHELDGDSVPLSSNGRVVQRDIVQFVPFRDFVQRNASVDQRIVRSRLAKEVLAEIPQQFLSYMKMNNIRPHLMRKKQTVATAPQLDVHYPHLNTIS